MSGAIRVTPSSSGRGLTLSASPRHGAARGAPPIGSGPRMMQRDLGAESTSSRQRSQSRRWMRGMASESFQATAACSRRTRGITLGDDGSPHGSHRDALAARPRCGAFGLEGSRQASDAGEADNRVTLRAALRF